MSRKNLSPAQELAKALLVGLSLLVAGASGLGTARAANAKARDLKVPIYAGTDPRPVGLFQAARVRGDFQRRGFFRIGALPMIVVEDARLELRDPRQLASALAQVRHRLLSSRKSDALEFRRLVIRVTQDRPVRESREDLAARKNSETGGGTRLPASATKTADREPAPGTSSPIESAGDAPSPRPDETSLSAARVRANPAGDWELLDGVVWQSGGKSLQAARALLRLDGPHAGRLTLETSGGPTILNLFATSDPTPLATPTASTQ